MVQKATTWLSWVIGQQFTIRCSVMYVTFLCWVQEVSVCIGTVSCWDDTQRQARELISGPSLGAKAKFLSFNRIQSRAVTDLLTGHNTLRRHLHLLGLPDSPLCRKCRVQERTSTHSFCECQALASLRHAYLDFLPWSRRILRA